MEHSTPQIAWPVRPTPGRDRRAPMSQLPMALFDEIECGLIVCDGHSSIRFVNQAARVELGARRVLQRIGGYLRRTDNARGDLDGAVREASTTGRRALLRLGQHDDRLMVTVLPLGSTEDGPGHVLVMLGRRSPCSELGLEMMGGSYGLTLAERRVWAALMREATPREIARDNAVSLSTVRTQITSIRIKLGARRIEGLLLRAAEMPPLAGALRQGFGSDSNDSENCLQAQTIC